MIDVVCGVIKNGDKYLITQRGDKKNYGKWEFPGGKVKENEHPFDSIKREIREELGIEISPSKEVYRETFNQFNLIFIFCVFEGDKKQITIKEHLKFMFVNSNEFYNYDFLEGDINFIKNYKTLF